MIVALSLLFPLHGYLLPSPLYFYCFAISCRLAARDRCAETRELRPTSGLNPGETTCNYAGELDLKNGKKKMAREIVR
jgi:hypothetical protein